MNKMPATLADQPQPCERLLNYANTLGQGILNAFDNPYLVETLEQDSI